MMKKYFAILVALLCLFTCLVPCNMIFADGPAVTIDYAAPVDVGSTFTVTLRFTSATPISKVDGYLTYDANVIEYVPNAESGISGGGGYLPIVGNAIPAAEQITISLTFEAKAAGSTVLAVSCNVLDESGNSVGTAAASAPLKANDSTTLLSGNANLASLTIPAGTLTPAFSPNVTEYTVEVDNSVTTFLVTAKAEEPDKVQGVSITGSQYLSVGTNQRAVTVIAQDGTQKKYTITIHRAAPAATPTPEKTEAPVTTPPVTTAPPVQTQTPVQDTPAVTDQATAAPTQTIAPATATPATTPDTGMSVNDLKNTIVIVLVILAIIIIVILFTVVYCMQQKDKKKRGNGRSSRSKSSNNTRKRK